MWSQFFNDIHSTPSIKIQVAASKPLPNTKQYPLRIEALEGIHPVTEAHIAKGLIIHYTNPYNTPILPPVNRMGRNGSSLKTLELSTILSFHCA